MSETTRLTDAELAAINFNWVGPGTFARIIADLRAERAVTAREKLRADRADEALVYLEQKTARLRAALEEIAQIKLPASYYPPYKTPAHIASAALAESEG